MSLITKEKKIKSVKTSITSIIIDSIKRKNGEDITLIDLKHIPNTLFESFVICTAQSSVQFETICDDIILSVQSATKLKPISVEGQKNMEWLLIDYFDTVVHVFLPETRSFFRLEQLWSDAIIKKIN